MPNAATRLLTLIALLQREPNQKAGRLAEQLGVSIRTLHRYFAMLDEMGIPIYSERGPHGGFSLVRGYKMPPLVLSPDEAVAVHLGTSLVAESWGKLYREAAAGAMAKLDNLLPDEQRQQVAWARRSLVTSEMHRARFQAVERYMELLRRAIKEQRAVRMIYDGGSDPEAREREIHPYALMYSHGWWYAIGFCRLRDAVRTFRVDRIAQLALLDERFQLPADFDARQYGPDAMTSQSSVRMRMRFAPEGRQIALHNLSIWESVEEQSDGAVTVTISVPDLVWAASTALAFGPLVVVLEPEEARQTVLEWADAVRKQYVSAEGASGDADRGDRGDDEPFAGSMSLRGCDQRESSQEGQQ